jgi:hypothetical protein
MGVDNSNDETMEVQPEEKVKKPRKRRSATKKVTDPDPRELNINLNQTDSTEEGTGAVKKKRSGSKKKKTTTTNSKKRSSKKIKTVKAIALAEDDSNESAEKSELELQPTGQAEVSKVKVEVLPKPSAADVESQLTLLKEPSVMNLRGAKVRSADSPTVNTRVEAVREAVLPLRAIKVRNVTGEIRNIVTEIIPNKVIVQGIVHEQLFFVGTDNLVHHLADDIHFSTFLDIPGVQPGMNAQVSARIEDIITELAPDGLSIIKKIIIEVFVKVTETVQVNLATGDGPTLLLKEVIGENTAQTLIEAEVDLEIPAIKVDEIKGDIRDLEIEVIKDKVIIQGILHKQLFFVDTNNLERHQMEELPFSLFVDLPGAVPGMDVQVQSRIEAIFFNLVDENTLRQKAVLEFFVKVTENVRLQVALGTGPLFKVEEFVGENTVQDLSETIVTLPVAAVKVREIVAQLRNLVTHVIHDKVIVQGIIHKQIFFISTDNIERHLAEDIPFSLFLDIPGATPGDNVHIKPIIEAIFFDLISPTELRQKVIFAINAVVTRTLQINLVLGEGRPLFKLEQVVGENTKQVLVIRRERIQEQINVTRVTIVFPGAEVIGEQQIILRNTFELPVNAIKIKEIQAIITDLTAKVIPDGVVVEGVVEKTVFFVDCDNIVRSITERIPFSILVSIPGIRPDQRVEATVDIENISFNLDKKRNEVTQVVVLRATVRGAEEPQPGVSVVTNVTGPGIVTERIRVRALVLTPEGAIFQEFDVVTDVSGPGVISVTKRVIPLDVVNDGNPNPVPVEVVTDVQLA